MDASGSVESGNYPAELNQNKNLLWKSPLSEKGCSSPIVWENSIFLTSPVDGEDAVLGFSMNGEQFWQTPSARKEKDVISMDPGAIHRWSRMERTCTHY